MDDLDDAIGWAALLIGLFIVITYYRGSASFIQMFGAYANKTITFLQGR